MTRADVLETILDVLKPYTPADTALDVDTQLLELGLLDSAALVNVLLELEFRLGIRIGADDLAFDHFQSPRTLADALAPRTHG